MPSVIRRYQQACPRCALVISIVVTTEGTRFEYDLADWASKCVEPGSGSPLACTEVRGLLDTWMGR